MIESLKAYTVVEQEDLQEVNGKGYVLEHKKTKAKILLINSDDDNKVFTIGFRTPPSDDTGLPHIMEHSVLCGSRKFPAKDPFVELCKGSLNTFLNAMTYSDKTVYPVASCNEKDFHNLMHVYLDAVFYPNIYNKEEILMKEGWHYDINEEDGSLSINGIVYNEMKGVYSSAEQILFRQIEKSLLSNTPYGFDSGGDPDFIPELTYNQFLDFHKKYYHPSNSYIYLYGNMDFDKELEFIDKEYLSGFEYLEVDSDINDEEEFTETKRIETTYSISDSESLKDNTYLSYNTVIGNSCDKKLVLSLNILEYVLLQAPGAVLKEALIDACIGKDIISSYDSGIKQPIFSVVAKNANIEDEDKFISIIHETLKDIVNNGINRRSLEAAINYFEFKHKEANYGRYPKGLMLGLNAFSSWLYDDLKALLYFSMNEVFELLRNELDSNYFEQLIDKYLLHNIHKSIVVIAPEKGLTSKKELELKDKLSKIRSDMNSEDITILEEKNIKLNQYQESESTKDELESIPLLELDDIDRKSKKLKNTLNYIEYIPVVSHNIFTNGISYLELTFNTNDLQEELYSYSSLLTEIFKYVNTKNYSYSDLTNEINFHTGGIGFLTTILNGKNPNEYQAQFIIKTKALDKNLGKAMELVDEILFTSDITNKKRLLEVISEVKSGLKNDLIASGHITTAIRAMSYIEKSARIKDKLEGIEYYRFLDDLEKNFDAKYEEISSKLQLTLSNILRRGSLTVSYTSTNDPVNMLKDVIRDLSNKLSSRPEYDKLNDDYEIIKNEGFKTASQVQYVSIAGNFKEMGYDFNGALNVLQVIFSYDYLWKAIREKGGAYGAMCSFTRSGNSYFTSYRDPNLKETYDVYKRAPEFVANFDCDKRDMVKNIIGAISKLDTPLTPSTEGAFCYVCYLLGITDEELQLERDQILNASVNAIRSLAPLIAAVINSGTICTIGNENKIEKSKEIFDNIIDFSIS